jgi:hypothetical protein
LSRYARSSRSCASAGMRSSRPSARQPSAMNGVKPCVSAAGNAPSPPRPAPPRASPLDSHRRARVVMISL